MYAVRVRAYQLYTETPYMTRIRGGPIVTNIFEQMVRKQRGELSRNFAIYSAHDTTLNFAMTALNVINQTTPIPDYGATLCLELYCDDGRGDCDVNVSASSTTFISHNFNTLILIIVTNTDGLLLQHHRHRTEATDNPELPTTMQPQPIRNCH